MERMVETEQSSYQLERGKPVPTLIHGATSQLDCTIFYQLWNKFQNCERGIIRHFAQGKHT